MAEGDLLCIYPNSDVTGTPFRVDKNRQILGNTTLNGTDGVFSSNLSAVNATFTGDIVAVGGFHERALFSTTNITNSLNVAMALMGQSDNTEFPPLTRAGSLLGISVSANAAATAGYASFYPVVNGTRQALTVALDATTNTTFAYTTIAKDSLAIAVGSRLGVTFSTNAAWTPGTIDAVVALDYEA